MKTKRLRFVIILSLLFSVAVPSLVSANDGLVQTSVSAVGSAEGLNSIGAMTVFGKLAYKAASGAAVAAGILAVFYGFLKLFESDIRRVGRDFRGESSGFVDEVQDKFSKDFIDKLFVSLSSEENKQKVREVIGNLDQPTLELMGKIKAEVKKTIDETITSATTDQNMNKIKGSLEGLNEKLKEELKKTIDDTVANATTVENMNKLKVSLETLNTKLNEEVKKTIDDTVTNMTSVENVQKVERSLERLNVKLNTEMKKTIDNTFVNATSEENINKVNDGIKKTVDGAVTQLTSEANMEKVTKAMTVVTKQATEDGKVLVKDVLGTGLDAINSEENSKKIEGVVTNVTDSLFAAAGRKKNTNQVQKLLDEVKQMGDDFLEKQTEHVVNRLDEGMERTKREMRSVPGVVTAENIVKYGEELPSRILNNIPFGTKKKNVQRKKKKKRTSEERKSLLSKLAETEEDGEDLSKFAPRRKKRKKKKSKDVLQMQISNQENQGKKEKKQLIKDVK